MGGAGVEDLDFVPFLITFSGPAPGNSANLCVPALGVKPFACDVPVTGSLNFCPVGPVEN